MYGADAYGSVPYAASSLGPDDLFDLDAMLSDDSAEFVYTVEFTVRNVSTDTESTLRIASREWATAPTDIPSSTPFDGRLVSFQFSRSINGGDGSDGRIGGMLTGEGSITFTNADGAFDTYIDEYAIDGRDVVVRIGRVTDPFVNHHILLRGQSVDWFGGIADVSVSVRDYGFRLDRPAQPTLYAGTGGKEGGADLTAKRKPIAYGRSLTFPMVLVDASLLIYQVHDGALTSNWGVHDKGVGVTRTTDHADYAALAAATIAAGDFDWCSAEGFIRLGAAPDGAPVADSNVATGPETSEIIADLISRGSDLTTDELDAYSFGLALGTAEIITFYVGTDELPTVAECIGLIMGRSCGYAGFSRGGKLRLGFLSLSSGSAVIALDEDEGDIISFDRERMPSSMWPPVYRWRVASERNWVVQTEFAASVSSALRDRMSQPYRLYESTDPTILADHPAAQDPPPIEAYYYNGARATDARNRFSSFFNTTNRLYRVVTWRRALQCEPGNLITVTHSRFGFDGGRTVMIVAIDDKISLGDGSGVDQVELLVFG